jgi:hypothetical protein
MPSIFVDDNAPGVNGSILQPRVGEDLESGTTLASQNRASLMSRREVPLLSRSQFTTHRNGALVMG